MNEEAYEKNERMFDCFFRWSSNCLLCIPLCLAVNSALAFALLLQSSWLNALALVLKYNERMLCILTNITDQTNANSTAVLWQRNLIIIPFAQLNECQLENLQKLLPPIVKCRNLQRIRFSRSFFLSTQLCMTLSKKYKMKRKKTLESTSIATYPTTAHKNQS